MKYQYYANISVHNYFFNIMKMYFKLKELISLKVKINPVFKKTSIIFRSMIVLIKLIFLQFKPKEQIKTTSLLNYVYEGFWGLIYAQQDRNEISRLLDLINKLSPKIVLEIGTCGGGTLFLFSRIAADDAKIISIDLPSGKFGGGYPKWRSILYKNFRHRGQRIHLLRRDSHSKETYKHVKTILNGDKIDFLFIDGDHTYRGVKLDYLIYSKLVRKGGIIALHDIAKHSPTTQCDVDKFWNEIKSHIPHKEIITDVNQGWAGIGIIYY